VATGLTQGKAEPEAMEELSHKHIPFAEAVHMIQRGEITDSVTVLGIMTYAYSVVVQHDNEKALAPH
jgi:hypothetical protein